MTKSQQDHEAAFTGYYLDRFSSGMPYVEWHSGQKAKVLPSANSYFEKKWFFNEEWDASKLSSLEYAKSNNHTLDEASLSEELNKEPAIDV